MASAVRIVDQVPGSERRVSLTLQIADARITARELMRRRIFEEVARHHAQPRAFVGLVAPPSRSGEDDEVAEGARKPLDWQRQFDVATRAFDAQRLILLVGGRQVESLDDEIEVLPDTEVVFLRLVPLVGG